MQQQPTQPEYVQLKLPFPPTEYDVLEIIELLVKSTKAVERGICRLAKDLSEGKVAHFRRSDIEVCYRLSAWIQGFDREGRARYAAKTLDATRLSDVDSRNLVNIFSQYCEKDQTVLDRAREICLDQSLHLTACANSRGND